VRARAVTREALVRWNDAVLGAVGSPEVRQVIARAAYCGAPAQAIVRWVAATTALAAADNASGPTAEHFLRAATWTKLRSDHAQRAIETLVAETALIPLTLLVAKARLELNGAGAVHRFPDVLTALVQWNLARTLHGALSIPSRDVLLALWEELADKGILRPTTTVSTSTSLTPTESIPFLLPFPPFPFLEALRTSSRPDVPRDLREWAHHGTTE
jgi:hypothetical protein